MTRKQPNMATTKEPGEPVTINLGWAADPLHKQMGVPKADLEHLQKDADAILRLRIRGYLNDKTLSRSYHRVIAGIPKAIEQARQKRRDRRKAARTAGAAEIGPPSSTRT